MKIALVSTDNSLSCQGLRTISSVLRQEGFDTRMVFMPTFARRYPERVVRELIALCSDFDVVGFTTHDECGSEKAAATIRALRECGNTVVWGGVYPTCNPNECLKHADAVCVGDGEKAFTKLCRRLSRSEEPDGIPGIWTRCSEEENWLPGEPCTELDSLPAPDYSCENHFVMKEGSIVRMNPRDLEDRVLNFNQICFLGTALLNIHTSRGCPNNCSYCTNTVLKRFGPGYQRVRRMSPAKIVKDICITREMFGGMEFVYISDDDFFSRPLGEIEEFGSLYSTSVGLPLGCYATPHQISREKLEVLVKNGLSRIRVGVQTGSERVSYGVYSRKISRRAVLSAASAISSAMPDSPPEYQFIIRNPYETEDDILKTMELILELPGPFDLQAFELRFFRGTDLYERALSDGVIRSDGTVLNKQGEREELLNQIIERMAGRRAGPWLSSVREEKLRRIVSGAHANEIRNILMQSKNTPRIEKNVEGSVIIETKEHSKESVLLALGSLRGKSCTARLESFDDKLLLSFEETGMKGHICERMFQDALSRY